MSKKVRKIYLCRPNLSPICHLNGVETDSVSINKHVKDFDELSFTVDRYVNIDGKLVQSNGYEFLNVAMYVHVENYGFFRMEYPALRNDGNKQTKEIVAYSSEKEVFNTDWVGLKINTAEEDSQEMLIDGNVTDYAMPKNLISFHNPYDSRFSLIEILISKTPLWHVGYIDPYLFRKTDENGDFIQETKKSPTGQDIPQTYTSSGRWVYTDDGEFEYEEKTITEPKYELKAVGIYQEDNVSIYAFLTSTLGPKIGALFFFDTENRLIHAISKYSLEHDDAKYDTGIFVGFRNLANSVDLSVEEDSVVTRVNCEGGEGLNFLDLNYGSTRLYNLSYFAHEPYMTQETADKVLAWQELIESKRAEYKELAEQAILLNDEIQDLTYRVPADENYWKNWSGMNEEALNKSLAYYRNEIAMLQESVDDTPRYDEDGKYIPYNSGKTDEWYEAKLALADNGYGGYGTYYETVTYIIPNIQLALHNLYLVSTDPTYIKPEDPVAYDWELYGIVQLQAQIKNLTNQFDSIKTYYGEQWPRSETPEAIELMASHAWNKQFYEKQRQEYIKLYNEIGPNGTAYRFLDSLYLKRDGTDRTGTPVSDQAVAESMNGQLSAIMSQMAPYKAYYDLSNYFNEEDLSQIYPLLIDTDYSNSNIMMQQTDTAQTKIDVEQELLDDCIDKVSELSQPQINFTSEVDNLYRIEQFDAQSKDLRLLNYIHLAVRDDYIVKLRVVGISWNPCDINSSLTLEFSNMITSRSGRSDFTDIINSENNRGQKNGISIGANGQISGSGDSIDYLTNLMEALSGTGLFKKKVKNVVENPVTGVLSNVNEDDFMFALKTVPGMSRFVLDSAQAAAATSGTTIMSGGQIKTGFINANYIAVDKISSSNYTPDPQSIYSNAGTLINLLNGSIEAKNFVIDSSGNATFRGTVTASTITGSTITGSTVIGSTIKNAASNPTFEVTSGGKITSKNAAGTSQTTIQGGLITTNNVDINGGDLNIGSGKFHVDSSGNLTATSATIKGALTATSLSTGSRTSSGTGTNGAYIDSSGNIYVGSSNQTVLYANGNVTIGGGVAKYVSTTQGLIVTNLDVSNIALMKSNNQEGGWISLNSAGQLEITGSGIKINGDVTTSSSVSCTSIYTSSNAYITGSISANEAVITNDVSCRYVWADGVNVANPGTAVSTAANCRITTAAGDSGWIKFVSTSTVRNKTILRLLEDTDVQKMFDIPVYYFKYHKTYLSKTDERYDTPIPGFIAEEIDKVIPIAVDHDEKGLPEMWNIQIVTPLMFQMIKSNRSEIDVLKDRVKELEDIIQKLNRR